MLKVYILHVFPRLPGKRPTDSQQKGARLNLSGDELSADAVIGISISVVFISPFHRLLGMVDVYNSNEQAHTFSRSLSLLPFRPTSLSH